VLDFMTEMRVSYNHRDEIYSKFDLGLDGEPRLGSRDQETVVALKCRLEGLAE
jgi:hypothetical protein